MILIPLFYYPVKTQRSGFDRERRNKVVGRWRRCMRRHDHMALFRRHSAKTKVVPNQMFKSVFQNITLKS
jgi:hypothetical protein